MEWIFDNSAKPIQWGKDNLYTSGPGTTGLHEQVKSSQSVLHTRYKKILKIDCRTNCKS